MSFIIACEGGKRKIAELLLENKEVDVTYTDEKGRTALHYAAHRGYLDLVKVLVEEGADIDYEDQQGETPYSLLASKNKSKLPFTLLSKVQESTSMI
ncbi:ankyrin repeat domain-containing protein [Sphingobacterium cellulitidis]|uniref:ankyrin repeat domain-containing protein n=1 Tax=Sphingobacterium cellulitidis TaxID=1768011 RepID=UPI0026A84839